ncbi:MAG: S1 family peptidase [Bryobacteraceae bacterium]
MFAAMIPPLYLRAVVALGSMQMRGEPGHSPGLEWTTEGTGFLYGYLVSDNPDQSKRQYELYLVTNRHVILEHAQSGQKSISVRLNPATASAHVQQFDLSIVPEPQHAHETWFFHPDPNIDIAAIRINAQFLHDKGFESAFFPSDIAAANTAKMSSISVSAGDGVFVLGFPMNLAGVQKNYVIVRQGCIARISDMFESASKTYLLDAFIFPGNSGSPVILRPEAVAIEGTAHQDHAYLIGIVRSYQPYTDIAISQQTKQPRIMFQENSGLAEVLPTDYIDESIKNWRDAQNKPTATVQTKQ